MNSRERLTRLFNKQEIDRVPIWLLAPYHKVDYYADIYENDSYGKLLPYIEKYCDTLDRRNYSHGFCYNANPEIKRDFERVKQGNEEIEKEIITYKDFKLEKYISRGVQTKLKYFVEDPSDLLKILDIPYIKPTPDFSNYQKEMEELGDKGLMMLDIGDPLLPLYHLMSAEDFSIFTLTDFDVLSKFLDVIYERTYDLYKYFLERNIGEVFFIVGAEFAGPPLVSPKLFSDLSVKYVKGLVDLIRSYGKKSIVHYHGNLFNVLKGMKEINPDGLHTIEAPPIGDCTITQAREALGDMILIGNIQYDDLARRNPEEIEVMAREALEEGKSGRFILSPTAGPYEEVLPEKTMGNYISFINAGIKYGEL